jgi:hypothetical protein
MPRYQNMGCDQGIVVNNQHNITLHTMEFNQDNKVV